MNDELCANSLGGEVVDTAGSVGHVATNRELTAREVLQDVRDQARVVQ